MNVQCVNWTRLSSFHSADARHFRYANPPAILYVAGGGSGFIFSVKCLLPRKTEKLYYILFCINTADILDKTVYHKYIYC